MRRLSILAMALVFFVSVFAANEEKYSFTTKMFLLEQQNGRQDGPRRTPRKGEKANLPAPTRRSDIASSEMVNGVECISAFIRLDDNTNVSDLEALGVTVREKFMNGLITAFIPVDKLDDVAAIARVKRINVASRMKPLTDKGRQYTNTDDVLTQSTDAIQAGLPKKYDGTGVLMGITDSGIDFQHKAFRDKNNGYRAVGAYQVKANGSSYTRNEYTQATMANATYDDASDHGTHTCSTAGGSSVIISGSNVTVTDDHASATYGGMAPGSDLWLAGIGDLNSADLADSFEKIINYAETNNMPVVISNSWGSGWGARDGASDFNDVVNKYFGDQYPNRVCLFASSNDAGNGTTSAPGGAWFGGTASSGSPVGSIMNCTSPSYGYAAYSSHIAAAWSRSSTSLKCNIYILNSAGTILSSKTGLSGSSNGTSVSGLSGISGTLYLISDYNNGKAGLHLYSNDYMTPSSSGNRIAIEVYPSSGSAHIDVWADGYNWFSADKTTNSHTWTRGSDDMSVSDEATLPNVISVGAYVSKTRVTSYSGSSYTYDSGSLSDIADFSSYATAEASPTGQFYPWIAAPGAQIVAAVNSHSTEYISGDSKEQRVNSNTTYPYGAMQGTSMATPTAAGIVAVWLQVAKENDIELTLTDIKTIMKESAIQDTYATTGSNHTHFGNGKIDCLAGIKYILDNYVSSDPTITASATNLTFDETVKGQSETQTLTVTGRNLTGNITATLGGANAAMFSLSPTTLSAEGGEITVTYAPTATGSHAATITLTSNGAQNVVVNVSGTATFAKALPVLNEASNVGATSFTASWTDDTEAQYIASYDLLVNSGNVTVDDEITRATTGVTGTSYSGWTDKEGESGAVYAGNSAGSYEAIQLRSSNNNSGIVTTTSGGKIKKVTVEWNSNTADGRTLNVYGKNTAYSAATDLYKSSTQGTLIGTIVKGTSTELEVDGDYDYVGVRSSSSAMYLDKITFTWEPGGSNNAPARASEQGDESSRTITGITAKSYTVENLTQGETYNFKVRSNYTDNTQSDWSAAKKVTLLAVVTPTLSISPAEVTIGETTVGENGTATFTVTGSNLTDDVEIALADENNVFSIEPATLTAAQAMAGAQVTVTFAPVAAGSFSATATASSTDAEAATVSISATAVPAPLVKYDPVLQPADEALVGTTFFTAEWSDDTPAENVTGYTLEVNIHEEPTPPVVTTLLSEDFSEITSNTSAITNFDDYFANSGWTGSYVYREDGAIRLASRNNAGSLTSPALDLSNSSGKVTVKFSAAYYGSDNSSVVVSCGDASQSTALTNTAADYAIVLDCPAEADQHVTFSTTAKQKRYNIYNLEILSGDATAAAAPARASEQGDENSRVITGITDKSYKVEGLATGATYNYKVKAHYADDTESAWSEEREVTLNLPTPVITATPAVIAFSGTYPEEVETGEFTVTGTDLRGDINVTLSGDDAFSIDVESIAQADAGQGAQVVVTFAPMQAGSFSATVTLSSEGADDVTVTLSGEAEIVKETPVMETPTPETVSTKSFMAVWNEVPNVESYTLQVVKQANGNGAPARAPQETVSGNTLTVTGITETSYVVANLEPATTYDYRVKAVYTDGDESDWSNAQSVTTKVATGIGGIAAAGNVSLTGRVLTGGAATRVYNVAGMELPGNNGVWTLAPGTYIVVDNGTASKIHVK